MQGAGADQHQPAWVFSSSSVDVETVRRMAAVRTSSRFRLIGRGGRKRARDGGWGLRKCEERETDGRRRRGWEMNPLLFHPGLGGQRTEYRCWVVKTCSVISAGASRSHLHWTLPAAKRSTILSGLLRIEGGPLPVICINPPSTSGVFGTAATPIESVTNYTVLVAQRTPAGTCMARREIHYSSLYPSADGSLCV